LLLLQRVPHRLLWLWLLRLLLLLRLRRLRLRLRLWLLRLRLGLLDLLLSGRRSDWLWRRVRRRTGNERVDFGLA
jgi:hypothetical protein